MGMKQKNFFLKNKIQNGRLKNTEIFKTANSLFCTMKNNKDTSEQSSLYLCKMDIIPEGLINYFTPYKTQDTLLILELRRAQTV